MMTIGDRIKQLRKFYPAFVAAQKNRHPEKFRMPVIFFCITFK